MCNCQETKCCSTSSDHSIAEVTVFTWGKKCDEVIYKNGQTICITDATSAINQRLVEDISYAIGHKLDWHIAAGRGYIKVMPEGRDLAIKELVTRYPNGVIDDVYSLTFVAGGM